MTKQADYRATLETLAPDEWDSYLGAESGLPGPRGNLELLQAVADVADAERIRRYAASTDEYRAACGAVGLGRLLAAGDGRAEDELRALATDDRWRVREGVAMALQRLGDAKLPALWVLANDWVDDTPLVQRAVAAGICEPRLLRSAEDARHALDLLDRITLSLTCLDRSARRSADVRVLRKSLGYCWSVAVAALPPDGFTRLERWAATDDTDVRWIVRENLKKARLAKADSAKTKRLGEILLRSSARTER
jgi:hypothetical protein